MIAQAQSMCYIVASASAAPLAGSAATARERSVIGSAAPVRKRLAWLGVRRSLRSLTVAAQLMPAAFLMRTTQLRLVVFGCAWLAVFTGCGYRTDDLFRSEADTVYIEMFANKDFRRDIEFKLTEALKKRIATDTPYQIASKEKADTILSGEVLEVRQAAFAPDFLSRLPREKQLSLAVRVKWQDLRSGRVLVDQPVLLQAADYLPPTGETEAFAQERAIDGLARRIVAKMYKDDW